MKTSRISTNCTLCFVFLLAFCVPTLALVAIGQSAQISGTPDPYFNQPVRPRVAAKPTNTIHPNISPRPMKSETWKQPGTQTNNPINNSAASSQSIKSSLWNAPRTQVTTQPVPNNYALNQPAPNRPTQAPSANPQTFAPSKAPASNSIIRESQPVATSAPTNNSFGGGSFGAGASDNSFGGDGSLGGGSPGGGGTLGGGAFAGGGSFGGAPTTASQNNGSQSRNIATSAGSTSGSSNRNSTASAPVQTETLDLNANSFSNAFSSNSSKGVSNGSFSRDSKLETVGFETTSNMDSSFKNPTPKKISTLGTEKITSLQTPATTKPMAMKQETEKSFEPSKVMAIVGGEPIFVGDLLFDINQRIEKVMGAAPASVKADARKHLLPKILPQFVDAKIRFVGGLRSLPPEVELESILEQAGQSFDENALEEMIKKSGVKSAAELDAQLRVQGSSLRKIRRMWSEEQLTRHLLQQQLNIDEDIPHHQMLNEYQKNIESYAIPAKSKWEQLMIRFDRTSSRAEAQRMIEEIGDLVIHGASLEAVAKKKSHGFMASVGGQHDPTSRGALVLKEIDEAIFNLPIGELSDIIETRDGFHIVRVLERTEDSRTPFREAQVEIKKRLLDAKRNAAFKAHMEKLRREIPVEYFTDEVAPPK